MSYANRIFFCYYTFRVVLLYDNNQRVTRIPKHTVSYNGIIYVVLSEATLAEAGGAEHTFEAQVLVDGGPVNAAVGEFKLLALLLAGIRQSRPEAELV